MAHAYLTVGLGFGDEGKGTMVDFLTHRYNIRYNVRYSGGPQCAHNVVNNSRHHTFAQLGSGSFNGADTILTNYMLVDPFALTREYSIFERYGNPKVYIDESCHIITPYHITFGKIREFLRGKNRHGSCGMGVGELRYFQQEWGKEFSLTVKDLFSQNILKEKINVICGIYRKELDKIIESGENLIDFPAQNELYFFHSNYFEENINLIIKEYNRFNIMPWWESISFSRVLDILNKNDTIFEGAQGTLLDEHYGFHPYTTWSTVTLHNAWELCKAAGVSSTNLGIIRAYYTRHGAGPFPTENNFQFPENYNRTHEWQGRFRQGYFDTTLFNYAVNLNKLHELAITHLDCFENTIPVSDIYYNLEYLDPNNFKKREEETKWLMEIKSKEIVKNEYSKDEFLNIFNPKFVSTGPETKQKYVRG